MLKVYGALASPYSMKLRAALRWLRVPHGWVQMGVEHADITNRIKPPVIPILEYPDGRLANDSTPLLLEFSAAAAPDRSLLPDDALQRFLVLLIEDFADEWLTKLMFHYRWAAAVDQQVMSQAIIYDRLRGHGGEIIGLAAAQFRDRQVGRMGLVGCGPEHKAQIEATYARLLPILEAMVPDRAFLFGSRPSLADFGLFGQLSQLAIDPTPSTIMRRDAPLTWRWLMIVDDTSGLDGAWITGDVTQDPAIAGLTALIAEVYLPFLAANAAAIEVGAAEFEVPVLGVIHRQPVFRYQAKCLAALRSAFASLDQAEKGQVEGMLGQAATAILEPG